MKKLFVLLFALFLTLGSSTAALAAYHSSGEELRPNVMLARISQEPAQFSKNSSVNYMDEVQRLQREQNEVSGYLKQAEALQQQAKNSGSSTQMPNAMKRYMDQNHLAYDRTGGDSRHDKDEWSVAIQSLEARLERLGTEVQQQMIHIQDFMSQYNSSIPEYSSANPPSPGTLASIARGQSLFSTSGATTMPATSLLAGIVLGMIAMWFLQRGKMQRGKIK